MTKHNLIAESLSKKIAGQLVLDNISFSINSGERVLLLGHNGAGKSTLLNILSGLQDYDSGSITSTFSSTAYQSHQLALYEHLSLKENLLFFLKMNGQEISLDELLSKWNLSKSADKLLGQASQGVKFRTALASTFSSDAELMLLDEPTTSLDLQSVKLVVDEIKSQENKTFLIASHDVSSLAGLIDRVLILENGALVVNEDLKETIVKEKITKVNELYEELKK
ncbi:MAG: ABC transporter ATP-binding protein [Bdellovibrionota bacterium]